MTVPRPDLDEIRSEAFRIAYSVERAEREGDKESGGCWQLRGVLAALLWTLGTWDEALPPELEEEGRDAAEHAVLASRFEALIEEYAQRYPFREAADAQPSPGAEIPDGGDEQA